MSVTRIPPAGGSAPARLCLVSHCDEPPTENVSLVFRGELSEFAICVEHAHDLDWGVIEAKPNEAGRGYLGRADEPESFQSA